MSRIWTPETFSIVREHWGTLTEDEIAERVNEYLRSIHEGKHKSWWITAGNGVRFAAYRLGIISKEEYEQITRDKLRTKRKARAEAGWIDPKTREWVLERDGKCLCCGAKENLSIDHIIPVAMGGKPEPENLQVLCRSCNSSKGASIIDYRKRKKHKRWARGASQQNKDCA